jgi:type I restriction enzyme S subunit
LILQSNYKESSIGPIPYDWEIVKMEKVCEKIIDCLHSKKPTFIKKSDKIYLEVVNIGDSGELNLETVNYINNKDFNFWTKRILPKHKDIIITKTGRIGAVAMIPLNLYCCIGRNQVIIRADNNKILSEFLLYYLLSPQFNKELKMQKMLGTILESLHVKNIPKIRVLLPDLKEQYQIVKLLKPLYEKKELNDQINKTLEEMAQAIFKHWFIDFEFPDENGEPYKSSGGEMVGSELGPIPKEWGVIPFKEIINISSGKRPKIMNKEKDKGFNIPLIGASSIMGYVSETLYVKPILGHLIIL